MASRLQRGLGGAHVDHHGHLAVRVGQQGLQQMGRRLGATSPGPLSLSVVRGNSLPIKRLTKRKEPMKGKGLALAGAVVAGAALLMGAAAGGQHGRPGEKSGPVAPGAGKVLRSEPGGPQQLVVWRNGKYHTITLNPRRELVELPEGGRVERIVMDSAEAERQLPPVDPALSHLMPTPQQVAESKAAHGMTDELPPPPANRNAP